MTSGRTAAAEPFMDCEFAVGATERPRSDEGKRVRERRWRKGREADAEKVRTSIARLVDGEMQPEKILNSIIASPVFPLRVSVCSTSFCVVKTRNNQQSVIKFAPENENYVWLATNGLCEYHHTGTRIFWPRPIFIPRCFPFRAAAALKSHSKVAVRC